MWATKQYVWATRFQFLGAQVATKALKSVCSSVWAQVVANQMLITDHVVRLLTNSEH